MGLERLDRDKRFILESKNIFFAGFSSSNIKYFIECFPEFVENVCGVFAILDIDDRTQVSVEVGNRTFEVSSIQKVKTLDASDSLIVIMYEYENEAYEKLLRIRETDDIGIYWFADKATEYEIKYRDKYNDYELEDIIIFRSGPRKYVYGDDFNENSRALFEHMVKNGYNRRWRLVWFVYMPESECYYSWRNIDNVEFIALKDKEAEEEKERDLYFRYLSLAKYAFVTDDETFFRRRRKGQTLIQLWHGDGVKGRTRFRRMEKRFEYMVCTSVFFAEIDYKDFGLRKDQMIPSGCPKDDWVLSSDNSDFSYIGNMNKYNHFILWGPTFRKSVKGLEILNEKIDINETGLPILSTWDECDSLNNALKENNCLMVIKLHPLTDISLYKKFTYSNIVLLTNQDLFSYGLHINQIMSEFDAFITDYSSAATSYMILDRPMAFTLDDLDEFDDSRGFVLNPVRDYLPGRELYTVNDMLDFISEVCMGRDTSASKRRELTAMMLDFKDNKNSERLLERLGIEK